MGVDRFWVVRQRRRKRIPLIARIEAERPAVGFSQPRGSGLCGPGEGGTSASVLDPSSVLAGKLQLIRRKSAEGRRLRVSGCIAAAASRTELRRRRGTG